MLVVVVVALTLYSRNQEEKPREMSNVFSKCALRRLTTVVSAGPKLTRRFLLLPPSPNDVLLQRHDLLPCHQNYLQAIGKEDFTPSPIVEVAAAPWLAIVLPLQIEDGRVVPIPLIIDTGAPGFMYLGTGCRRALAELGVLEEVVGAYPYRLRGAVYRGDTRVFNPPAWNLIMRVWPSLTTSASICSG